MQELKRAYTQVWGVGTNAFNRTMQELKQYFYRCCVFLRVSFNRTMQELKLLIKKLK